MTTKSGREELPIEDRIGLLEQDILDLKKEPGHYYWQVYHSASYYVRRHRGTLHSNWGGLSESELEQLSDAELKVMAWKRGGSKEYLRLRKQNG